jgi:hypothetical protein
MKITARDLFGEVIQLNGMSSTAELPPGSRLILPATA